MATTGYGVNDALAVKQWSRKLAHEALKATPIAPLIGSGMDSVITRKTELEKDAGDKITCGLRTNLGGDGTSENQTLEGNEEALTTYSDALFVNELNHAVRVKNKNTIDVQRVPFNLRNEGKSALRDWYAKRTSVSFFLHACGYTGASYTNDAYTVDGSKAVWNANNTITAPTSNRHIWVNGSDDQSLSSSHVFSLTMVDYAKEVAKGADGTIPIRPIMIGGAEKYVMYLHPYQVTDLRTNTSTGQWFDIQRAAAEGGRVSKNPIYNGALGEYNGVVLREANDVTPGVNSSTSASVANVRRAVFLGAQSAMIAFTKAKSPSSFKWVEKTFDYDRELGISAQTIWGLKKCVFNSEDFGSIVVSSYAAAHA